MKALKLKGWVDGILGSRSQAEIATAHWFAVKPVPDMVRATLVIADKAHERVFTESEVRAMLQSAMTQVGFVEPEVRLLAHFKTFGFDLDPA